MKSPPIVPRNLALKLAKLTAAKKYQDVVNIISTFPDNGRSSWGEAAKKFIPFLLDRSIAAPYRIFTKGNSKLPFYSFSNLPIVNCPGKGECVKWCYSLKAWQYPFAFFRQLQNTILVNEQSPQLVDAFNKLPRNTDVRLYVDGDFNSAATLEFWFKLISDRSDLKVYGYSKSWELFLDYFNAGKLFPSNYVLNLSSGSKYDNFGPTRAAMQQLPITRGEFVAINAPRNSSTQSLKQIAQTFGMKKIFVCPGQCGSCIKKQGKNVHACGSKLLKGTTVVIQTH